MPANRQFLAAFCTFVAFAAAPAPPTPSQPTIEIGYAGDDVEFLVDHPTQIFLGGAIASLSPNMTHYLTDIPPLLSDHVILGAGVGYPGEGVSVIVPQALLPRGVTIYAQGVTLTDEVGIEASRVDTIFLPIAIEASGAGN